MIVVASVVFAAIAACMAVFAGRLIGALCALSAALIRDDPTVILAAACGAVLTLLCVGAAAVIIFLVEEVLHK